MIDSSKEFYQKELDLMYEILNRIQAYLDYAPDDKKLLEFKDIALFRIGLLKKILATFIN